MLIEEHKRLATCLCRQYLHVYAFNVFIIVFFSSKRFRLFDVSGIMDLRKGESVAHGKKVVGSIPFFCVNFHVHGVSAWVVCVGALLGKWIYFNYCVWRYSGPLVETLHRWKVKVRFHTIGSF